MDNCDLIFKINFVFYFLHRFSVVFLQAAPRRRGCSHCRHREATFTRRGSEPSSVYRWPGFIKDNHRNCRIPRLQRKLKYCLWDIYVASILSIQILRVLMNLYKNYTSQRFCTQSLFCSFIKTVRVIHYIHVYHWTLKFSTWFFIY